ncbi:hypothetical protein DM02DRAFT_501288, partial [Periconia macrospinosa]
LYVMTGPLNKIAMLCMYRRIFDTPFFSKVVLWGIMVNIAWWLAMSLSGVFACKPIQAYWHRETKEKKCFRLMQYDLGYAIVNISLDFFILCLPVRQVWKLHLDRAQKIAISFIFLIGALWVVIVMRLLWRLLANQTRVYLDVMIWTAIEPLVSVISINLPMLRPLLAK